MNILHVLLSIKENIILVVVHVLITFLSKLIKIQAHKMLYDMTDNYPLTIGNDVNVSSNKMKNEEPHVIINKKLSKSGTKKNR